MIRPRKIVQFQKKLLICIILPKNRANGLVKKSFNFNTRYDKTNQTQILA